MEKGTVVLSVAVMLLLAVISATGVLSRFPAGREIINPYGNAAKMYGKGIDARDSHFAATLFIGTDFMILFLFAPLFARTFFQNVRKPGPVPRLKLVSVCAAALYYAASVSLGVA